MSMAASAGCLVAKVDHLGILADDADNLFRLFAETFQLPVVLPMTEHPGFASGGVLLGNAGIEFIRNSDRLRQFALPGRAARYWLMAFQPCGTVEATVAELRARGIPYRQEAPGAFWTNVTLTDLAGCYWAFLCHYEPQWYQQYPALTQQLQERGGGPLGVDRVQEVVVGTRDVAEADRWWGQLLSPTSAARPGYWQVGDGPTIHLVPADEDGIAGLVLQVRDLDHAVRFLRDQQLLGGVSAERAKLAPERLGSLQVHLTAMQD